MSPTARREFTPDIIRILACFLVMWQHASESYYIAADLSPVRESSTAIISFITSLCRAAVPLFVMTSGYFLLPMRGSTSEFFRRRATRIVLPFVLWAAVYAIYFMVSQHQSLSQCLVNIAHIPVNYGTEIGHMWYVYMLIGLYLLVPVISPWLQTASRTTLRCYLGIWLVASSLPYIHLVFPEVFGECYWNPTPMLYYFTGFAGYFILGFYIRKYGDFSRIPSLLMLAGGYAATALVFNSRIATAPTVADLELSWQQCSVNVAFMSCGLFCLIHSLRVQADSLLAHITTDIARKGYAIYLAHLILIIEMASIVKGHIGPVYVEIPVITLAAFLLTYMLISILYRLPKADKWVG